MTIPATAIPSRPSVALQILANLVCVSALLPFVSLLQLPGLPRTDVQLTATIIASTVLFFLLMSALRMLTVTKTDLVLIFAGFFSLMYVDWSRTNMSIEWVRSAGQILLGLPVYYAVRNLYKFMSPMALVFTVALYFAMLLIQIFAPSLYYGVAPVILSDVRSGLAGLTQEPSQMATLAIFFILAPLIFKKDSWGKHRRAYWFVILTSTFMLVMTQSATAAFLVIVLLLVWFLALSKVRTFWKVLLLVGLLALNRAARNVEVTANELNRAESIALEAARNPLYAIQDRSLAMRQTGLYVGLINLPQIPFGNGSVTTDYSLADNALRSSVMDWLARPEDWPVIYAYAMGTYEHPTLGFIGGGISLLGQGIQRMGIFYLVIMGLLLMLIRGPRESLLFKVLFLAFVTNGPIVMSVIWFMLGCFAAVNTAPRKMGVGKVTVGLDTKLGRQVSRSLT